MTNTDIKTEELQEPWQCVCPNCGRIAEDMMFTDGETIDFDGGPSIDPSQVSTHLVWGNCPHCKSRIYMVELQIGSATKPGYFMSFGNQDKAANTEAGLVNWRGKKWLYNRYTSLKDVQYQALQGAADIQTGKLNWLYFHALPFFCCDEGEYAFDKAEAMCAEIIPELLKAKLHPQD